MATVETLVHGAVSLVNAISTGNGATLGIDTFVKTRLETKDGTGIYITSDNKTISSRLINKVIENIVPKRQLEKTRLELDFKSNIPTGYGLKSSSAISTAVSMACSKAFKKDMNDKKILKVGVESSIQTKVSITGAFDDACACYYGGFNVTNNYKRDLIFRHPAPKNLEAIIFLPKSRKRGNLKKLKNFKDAFEKAWEFARKSDYWNAAILNGIATSSILNSNPELILKLVKKGAIGATISGNGPSIVAIVKRGHGSNIKKEFSSLEGNVLVSSINNKKAEVHEV
jgi:shikimate kinase|tara:strand:+ start:8482 stop:9336 length:855 start_codon:yes stop_codon:yes gene_type:complete